MRDTLVMLLLCLSAPIAAQTTLDLPAVLEIPASEDFAALTYQIGGDIEITTPDNEYIIVSPASYWQLSVTPAGTFEGCIVSDIIQDGEPLFWVYFVGCYAEAHIYLLDAFFPIGDPADAEHSNGRPFCEQYLKQHHNVLLGEQENYYFELQTSERHARD